MVDMHYSRILQYAGTGVVLWVCTIDIKKVDKQLTHAMHVKDRHVNDTFIDKLTKWYQ